MAKMFQPKMPTPAAAPDVPDPVRVPTAADPDVVQARKTAVQDEFAKRRGREATRLAGSAGRDTAYSRTTLG